MYPENLKYTAEHEWVRPGPSTDEPARVGITDYAQDALGDIVYVTLPDVGSEITAGEPCGEVESTKSVSDLYAPVSGTVVACNDALEAAPDLVNTDPYGEGWMFEVALSEPDALSRLLDVSTYQQTIDEG